MGCGNSNSNLEEIEEKLKKCDDELFDLTSLQDNLEAQLVALKADRVTKIDTAEFTSQILDRATEIEQLLDQVTLNFENYKMRSRPVFLAKTIKAEAPKLRRVDLERVGTAPVLTDPKIRALIESNRDRLKSAKKTPDVGISTSAIQIAF
mmetsp:Transcript_32709/g.56926  ORF Transcript_32709/g.56926 Transcript_32709/m.56926 type:complete len:150 (+) Transcript_32709:3989-4438(+)